MQLPGAAEGRIDIKEMRHLLPLPGPTIDNIVAAQAEEAATNEKEAKGASRYDVHIRGEEWGYEKWT